MQFVFADEIVCEMTTIIEDNSQSDLGPADGSVNVHLAVATTGEALHPTEKQLFICGLQSPFPLRSIRGFECRHHLPMTEVSFEVFSPVQYKSNSSFFWWGYASWCCIKLTGSLMVDDLTQHVHFQIPCAWFCNLFLSISNQRQSFNSDFNSHSWLIKNSTQNGV